MAAQRRSIFLAGAPERERLSWDEAALLSSFEPPLQRFVGDSSTQQIAPPSASAASISKWRSIPFEAADIEVSWPSQKQKQSLYAQAAADGLADSDFLEHSIAVLEHIDSSQLITSGSANGVGLEEDNGATFVSFNTTTSLTDSSLDSVGDSFDAPSATQQPSTLLPTIKLTSEITDLKRIPKAEHIHRIQPQTITVNLLVGIVAISPARTVQLRRHRLEREIVEITVGDDTRAGFGITFWLVPEAAQEKQPDSLRESLRCLRPGHIVLLKSVALSSFRGSVYGQSLNRRFARNSTGLDVLGDAIAGDLSHSSAAKLQRVRQWTMDFVGNARELSRHTPNHRGDKYERSMLPPDTQD